MRGRASPVEPNLFFKIVVSFQAGLFWSTKDFLLNNIFVDPQTSREGDWRDFFASLEGPSTL